MLKRRHLSLAGMDVLDFGCRHGSSSIAAARLGAASVVGIDVDIEALRLARMVAAEN